MQANRFLFVKEKMTKKKSNFFRNMFDNLSLV